MIALIGRRATKSLRLALKVTLICGLACHVTSAEKLPAETTSTQAKWIWCAQCADAPKNQFTYFRRVVDLDRLPTDPILHVAADSTAHVWINGHIVQRKMTRFFEDRIRTEQINAGPYLHIGRNVVLILHQNWGPIVTFQRSANTHAGLYVRSSWLRSDSTWRAEIAPEYASESTQITGVTGDMRIRYPELLDGRRAFKIDPNGPSFDDSLWPYAVEVKQGPWPKTPLDVETDGQREDEVNPISVLAAGTLRIDHPLDAGTSSIAERILSAVNLPSVDLTKKAGELIRGRSLELVGQPGDSLYLTVDFGRPVHGYPFLVLNNESNSVQVDLGYGELSYSQYSGKRYVTTDGWLDPTAVVGKGYADSYIARLGEQRVEMPDERTARWVTVHVHFSAAGRLTLRSLGIVESQYPATTKGSFVSGDETMDEIVRLALVHAKVSMTETYVDTPGREDGQWIEDARLRALLSSRWFGDTKLRQVLIRLVAESQMADGNFHPFPPSNYKIVATYDWGLQWVGALWDDYEWTADPTLIRKYWPTLTRYWHNVLSHEDAEGLWCSKQVYADIRVGVHPHDDAQSSSIVSAQLMEQLQLSARMARRIGYLQQARTWELRLQELRSAFGKYHVVPTHDGLPMHVDDLYEKRNASGPRGFSQAAQVAAVLADLLPPSDASADLRFTFPSPDGTPPSGVVRWNNPTFSYRALTALSRNGLDELALRHLKERFAPYLPGNPRNPVDIRLQGALGGPLPEYFVSREDLRLSEGQQNPAQPRDESGSHGWGAVPLLWLHESLLGVLISKPGGSVLSIAPEDAGLPYVSGSTITPKGVVSVDWQPRSQVLQLQVPGSVVGLVTLPSDFVNPERVSIPKGCSRLDRNHFRCSQAGSYIFSSGSAL